MEDVFKELEKSLLQLGANLQPEYEAAVIEEMDKSAIKLYDYFMQNSGSNTLNDNMVTYPVKTKFTYTWVVDWDDKKIVNELKRKENSKSKGWGQQADKPRGRGKRNYSIRPATVHDLAYIIEHGEKNADGTTKRLGTYFIKKGMRRLKQSLDSNIEKNYEKRLVELESKLLS